MATILLKTLEDYKTAIKKRDFLKASLLMSRKKVNQIKHLGLAILAYEKLAASHVAKYELCNRLRWR